VDLMAERVCTYCGALQSDDLALPSGVEKDQDSGVRALDTERLDWLAQHHEFDIWYGSSGDSVSLSLDDRHGDLEDLKYQAGNLRAAIDMARGAATPVRHEATEPTAPKVDLVKQELLEALKEAPCKCKCDMHESDWGFRDDVCLYVKRGNTEEGFCIRALCKRCVAIAHARAEPTDIPEKS
jgi:hypothetical protein